MDWSLIVPLAVTALIGVTGWFVIHLLSSARDRENKKRDLRAQYLIEAYRRLEGASNRQLSSEATSALESAVADVQLFGTREQVGLAREFALGFASQGSASLDLLLGSLRRDLRSELKLAQVDEPITFLRVERQEAAWTHLRSSADKSGRGRPSTD